MLPGCISPMPRELTVVLGKYRLRQAGAMEQKFNVTRVVPHPCYNKKTLDNDIMLLQLSGPVARSKSVWPVTLPRSCPNPGESCIVSGWGTTRSPGGRGSVGEGEGGALGTSEAYTPAPWSPGCQYRVTGVDLESLQYCLDLCQFGLTPVYTYLKLIWSHSSFILTLCLFGFTPVLSLHLSWCQSKVIPVSP